MHDLRYISTDTIELEDRKAIIELLPAGEWLHPAAPKGKLVVTEQLLDEFIGNFKDKIVGPELPIDFRHEGETGNGVPFVGGWIVDMIKKIDALGRKAIYAVLHITDSEVAKRIKEKSLKYISPSIAMGFQNPENGKMYNVIRAASLTNWPYIKNMSPVSPMNFEEIQSLEASKGGEHTMSDRFKELEAKDILTFEEFEEYRTLLNDDSELDAQEVAFKLKEAFAKKEKKEEKTPHKEDKKKIDEPEGGDVKMTEELKTKLDDMQKQIELYEKQLEEGSAKTFAMQEKMREKDIQNEITSLVSSGRITPAMAPLATKIMFSGENAKAKVQINLSDGKVEEQETNVRALFAEFIAAMPSEWKVNLNTEGKKGVVVDDKLTLTEGSVSGMSAEEYEAKRAELLRQASPARALGEKE